MVSIKFSCQHTILLYTFSICFCQCYVPLSPKALFLKIFFDKEIIWIWKIVQFYLNEVNENYSIPAAVMSCPDQLATVKDKLFLVYLTGWWEASLQLSLGNLTGQKPSQKASGQFWPGALRESLFFDLVIPLPRTPVEGNHENCWQRSVYEDLNGGAVYSIC